MTEIYLPPEEEISIPTTVVPHSREAEESVIGSVFINPEVYYDVAQFLAADDFYIHRHRWIWESFVTLHEQRTPIDLLTVADDLDRRGRLAEIGGPAYLTALVNQVPTSLNAESYGRIIEGHSVRRKMISAANAIAQAAYDQSKPLDIVQEEASKSLYATIKNDKQSGEYISEAVSRVYDNVDENAKRIAQGLPLEIGLTTGWIDLDKLLFGIRSEFIVVAGRPSTGKTAFLMGIGKHVAMNLKKRVAIFSQEMSNDELAERFISMETGIDSQRIRSGQLQESEWPAFTHAVEVLSSAKIYLEDTSFMTPAKLKAKCMKLASSDGLDLIIVDYIQLMESGAKRENRTQEVSYISRQLKLLGQDLKIPVIAASQLSRAVEQRNSQRPILSDLRESGSIEQDANGVIFLYRPSDQANITTVILEKRRNGPVGELDLVFRAPTTSFVNAARQS